MKQNINRQQVVTEIMQLSPDRNWSDQDIFNEHICRYPNDINIRTRQAAIRNVLQRGCKTAKQWNHKDNLYIQIDRNEWRLVSNALPSAKPQEFDVFYDNDKNCNLQSEISRIARNVTNRVRQGGKETKRIHPIRNSLNPKELRQLMQQQWFQQNGKCGLCGTPISLDGSNELLQMSHDRIDSLNPSYDRHNTHLTHKGCNLAKNESSKEKFDDFLATIKGST